MFLAASFDRTFRMISDFYFARVVFFMPVSIALYGGHIVGHPALRETATEVVFIAAGHKISDRNIHFSLPVVHNVYQTGNKRSERGLNLIHCKTGI